jgi:hypothetical protein
LEAYNIENDKNGLKVEVEDNIAKNSSETTNEKVISQNDI